MRFIGHNGYMRSADGGDVEGTIAKLNNMVGIPLVVKVNKGRNRIETLEGMIENVYPKVFTVRAAGGEVSTFTHADILSHNILFYRGQK